MNLKRLQIDHAIHFLQSIDAILLPTRNHDQQWLRIFSCSHGHCFSPNECQALTPTPITLIGMV